MRPRISPEQRQPSARRLATNWPLVLTVSCYVLAITFSLSLGQDNPSTSSPEGSSPPRLEAAHSDDPKIRAFRANEALGLIRTLATRFGRDIHYGTSEATCARTMRDRFDPAQSGLDSKGSYRPSIVSIDWNREHSDIVRTISNTMGWHKSAVEAIARESERLAGNHSFVKNLRFDYVDVHRLQAFDEGPAETDPSTDNSSQASADNSTSPDPNGLEMGQLDANGELIGPSEDGGQTQAPEPMPTPSKLQSSSSTNQDTSAASAPDSAPSAGEWETPIAELKFQRHPNFDVMINTEESAVHIPVHIFPGDPQVMNGIAWSNDLTKVFRDNFVRNPKLTNQYFASQLGFMRLFPAQSWQIPRTNPDLYDARMRPWYVAGASSRKDVVILVDSSGSMTGSRRDIAKGVVFEILDTLTDNDHFLILKFSDVVQQVGVPSCSDMQPERRGSTIPAKNTVYQPEPLGVNGTDISSLFLLPATGRNVRHIKTNFTIPTAGIANFSHAIVTAFEVLYQYRDSEQHGSQCNQAIMLITDGSPSDFQDIFNRYNYGNAPVRVFTYLIGREAGDGSHTKMMACHNRGYYTHVINLAEVRETVQQYIPVMARPLVLNGTHPITWTPAYGELTYQILTDWIWESKRRDKARAVLASSGRGSSSNAQTSSGYIPDIRVTSSDDSGGGGGSSITDPTEDASYEAALDEELDAIDLFGYNGNLDCFWQTKSNDLLTTVVQPVYDRKNESVVTEKFLVKNVWTIKETVMRTAQILGVAAADMKINDIIALAPSHKLGANGYAIMLTNNGFAMHHPDLRSILEPFSSDPSEKNMRILKPFFSSMDFTQVEHVLDEKSDENLVTLRKEAVAGLTGWRELLTKRSMDCQKRVQSRKQSFYYKPIQQFPFSFMIAIPQPYGSHRIKAQVEIKDVSLPERLTTYFTTSDYDLWTVHPDYSYCDGPSNNTIATLLDMFHRIEAGKLDDIQWRPAESTKPPLFLPGKIVCDKDLVQSLVYDAVATYGFSEARGCGPPSPSAEPSLLGMFGVRFSFVATRSGLTRVRHPDVDDLNAKKEALAFARKHPKAIDETYYTRTVDYNMLVNDSASLIQVPFITHRKIRDRLASHERSQLQGEDGDGYNDIIPDGEPAARFSLKNMSLVEKLEVLTNSSIHVIATQSIIVNEGAQRAVAGVSGVFYDYGSFAMRFINSTNSRLQDGRPLTKPATCYTGNSNDEACDGSREVKCGASNDTIDCLLIDNNGYIVFSEDLDFVGRHLKAYDSTIMSRLVRDGVYHTVNITDYQSICMRQEEKQTASSSSTLRSVLGRPDRFLPFIENLATVMRYSWSLLVASFGSLIGHSEASQVSPETARQLQALQPILSLLPNKTYLRPCENVLTLYETRPGIFNSDLPETYKSRCGCDAWFVYEQVPQTNLIMLIVDLSIECRLACDLTAQQDESDEMLDIEQVDGTTEGQVCSMLQRDHQLYRKKLDSCFNSHPDEEQIKLCGGAGKSAPICNIVLVVLLLITAKFLFETHVDNRS